MYCLNPQHIINPYTGESVTCSCRQCEPCLVEYANSISQRIFNHISYKSQSERTYFVTLTYSDDFLPVVFKEEASRGLPYVYRGRTGIKLDFSSKDSKKFSYVDDVISSRINDKHLFWLPSYNYNAIGVIYSKDSQLFLKRLRKYLNTHGIFQGFSCYVSHEYGETTYRPHIHLLITTSIPAEILRTAIVSSWPYCIFSRLKRWFEEANKPASYLSTYVCDGGRLPLFYKLPLWRQKKTHSLHYGFNNPSFGLFNFYASAKVFNHTYHIEFFDKNGHFKSRDIPFPNYVRNRYFPIIKGFFRLSRHEFLYFATNLVRCHSKFYKSLNYDISRLIYKLGYNPDDITKAWQAFERCRYFARQLNVSFIDYVLTLYDYCQNYRSYRLISLHLSDTDFLSSFRYYDNLSDCFQDIIFTDTSGVYRRDEVLSFVENYKFPKALEYIDKYKNNKYVKKIKARTALYYGLNADYFSILYG